MCFISSSGDAHYKYTHLILHKSHTMYTTNRRRTMTMDEQCFIINIYISVCMCVCLKCRKLRMLTFLGQKMMKNDSLTVFELNANLLSPYSSRWSSSLFFALSSPHPSMPTSFALLINDRRRDSWLWGGRHSKMSLIAERHGFVDDDTEKLIGTSRTQRFILLSSPFAVIATGFRIFFQPCNLANVTRTRWKSRILPQSFIFFFV